MKKQRYTPEAEKEILEASLAEMRPFLPVLPTQSVHNLVSLFNTTGVTTCLGKPFKPEVLMSFLQARRSLLCRMAGKDSSGYKRTKASRRTVTAKKIPSVNATLPVHIQEAITKKVKTYTGVALNGGGDMVRTILADKHLRAELKLAMLQGYLEALTKQA